VVVLRHGDRYLTLFGHCAEIGVRRGQKVAAGETIATVGDTGWTTAPHLHYELRRRSPAGDWLAVDPLAYAFWSAPPLEEGPPAAADAPARVGAAAEAQPLPRAFLR
jgi:murein DD-endopeptidase MepM/ murein hydrolase activator NlpD